MLILTIVEVYRHNDSGNAGFVFSGKLPDKRGGDSYGVLCVS